MRDLDENVFTWPPAFMHSDGRPILNTLTREPDRAPLTLVPCLTLTDEQQGMLHIARIYGESKCENSGASASTTAGASSGDSGRKGKEKGKGKESKTKAKAKAKAISD